METKRRAQKKSEVKVKMVLEITEMTATYQGGMCSHASPGYTHRQRDVDIKDQSFKFAMRLRFGVTRHDSTVERGVLWSHGFGNRSEEVIYHRDLVTHLSKTIPSFWSRFPIKL